MPSEAKDYRDRIYKCYVQGRREPLAPDSLSGLRPRLPYLHRVIDSHFPRDRGAAILEIGCGHGALLYALAQKGYLNVRGVDGSRQQVEAAKRLGIVNVELRDLMDALRGTDTMSIDVIVAFDVIEHFTRSEIVHLVDEVHRVLKPGGRWIIHTVNAESPFGMNCRYGDFTHELAFTRLSVAQLLMASNFIDVKCFEDTPVAHGVMSVIRLALWQLIRLALLLYVAVETGSLDRRAAFTQNFLVVARRG